MRVNTVLDKEKDLSKKAIALETRRVEVQSLFERATDLQEKADNELAEGVRKIGEAERIDKEVGTKLEQLQGELADNKTGKEEYLVAKESYELTKKEIEPKLVYIKDKEALLGKREKEIDAKGLEFKTREIETKSMLEYISTQKEQLDYRKAKLDEREVDIHTK